MAMFHGRFLGQVLFLAVAVFAATVSKGGDAMSMSQLAPRECRGWESGGKDGVYTLEGIYKYMDGAGELYREYDYRELFVRRFLKKGQPMITVEVFDMGSDALAFGVFAHNRDGPEAGLGQDSEYRAGLLCFWKGRFFACVRAEEETPAAKQAVMDIGKEIAEAIQETGSRPRLLDALPKEGLIEENVRYFRKHDCLNYHYFISDENILRLGPDTEAVLAPYRQPEGRSYLLLVKYATAEAAKVAFNSFMKAYLRGADAAGLARTENGKWAGATFLGKVVAVVLDAATKEQAENGMKGVAGASIP